MTGRGFPAFVSAFVLTVVLIGPVSYMVAALVGEASGLYEYLQTKLAGESTTWLDLRGHPAVVFITEKLDGIVDLSQLNLKDAALKSLGGVSGYIVRNTTSALANIGEAAFHFALMILTMYYLFKDGDGLVDRIKGAIPMSSGQASGMLKHITDVIRATIYGGLLVALVQGVLGGILFWALDIRSPVFWGAVMAFLSLIPFLGAFLVFVPAAIILLLGGAYVKAMILLIFGIGVVSQIDNFLRPMLISGKTELHPFLLFFSIAGGLIVFGLLGLVLGPVIAAVFVAMFDLYRIALRQDLQSTEVVQVIESG
jgi:predicted PurR-regulated permease PerM